MKLVYVQFQTGMGEKVCEIINRNGLAEYVVQLVSPSPQALMHYPESAISGAFVRVPDDHHTLPLFLA